MCPGVVGRVRKRNAAGDEGFLHCASSYAEGQEATEQAQTVIAVQATQAVQSQSEQEQQQVQQQQERKLNWGKNVKSQHAHKQQQQTQEQTQQQLSTKGTQAQQEGARSRLLQDHRPWNGPHASGTQQQQGLPQLTILLLSTFKDIGRALASISSLKKHMAPELVREGILLTPWRVRGIHS